MMPRLGQKYQFECEVISKPIAEYQTDEYFELDLPTAPAVMVGDEIVVEGADVRRRPIGGRDLPASGAARAGTEAERVFRPPFRQIITGREES